MVLGQGTWRYETLGYIDIDLPTVDSGCRWDHIIALVSRAICGVRLESSLYRTKTVKVTSPSIFLEQSSNTISGLISESLYVLTQALEAP